MDAATDMAEGVAKLTLKQPLTVLWDQLPDWQQDNKYIISGHRPASGSYRKSIASLCYLHNETVNIYSHLLGAIVFGTAALSLKYILVPRYHRASTEDVYVFGCFFSGTVICLGMSATYHLTSNHSQPVASLGNKLDYLGIVFLICGSFIPSIYYGFTCEPKLITTYWTMITTIGAGCAVTSLSPTFRTPQWRPFRAGMFVAMGLSAVIPVFHGLSLYGIEKMTGLIGLPWLVAQGCFYVLGATIYAARIPERLKPGHFDIWGSSHQIFHILVLVAAACHLVGLIHAFDFHHSNPIKTICSWNRGQS